MTGSSQALALVLGLALAAAAGLCLSSRRGLQTVLHNASWSAGLLVCASGLIPYPGLTLQAWLVLICGVVVFNLAAVSGGSGDAVSVGVRGGAALVGPGAYRLLMLVFFAGWLVYLRSVGERYGFATLLRDPGSIRQKGDEAGYLESFPLYGKIMFYLGPLAFLTTVFPELVGRARRPTRSWTLLAGAAVLVAQLAVLQRTNIFTCLTLALAYVLLRPEQPAPAAAPRAAPADADGAAGGKDARRTGRKVARVVVAAAVLGVFVFQGLASVLGKTGTENSAVSTAIGERLEGSPAASLFLYVSSGIPAFGVLTESDVDEWPVVMEGRTPEGAYNPQTYGRATFAAPLKLVDSGRSWNTIAPFVKLPVPTNVYTWLEPWYRDYRLPGVVAGAALVGGVVGSLCRRRLRSPVALVLAAFVVSHTALAVFVNRTLTVNSIVVYLTLGCIAFVRAGRTASAQASPRLGASGPGQIRPPAMATEAASHPPPGRSGRRQW